MPFLKVFFLMGIFFTSAYALENKTPKVVVVGGGIAGLTTAYRLEQHGADVHLYEARGRVGGRILTITINGNIAELGGQNFSDGGQAENLHRLIEEFDLELTKTRVGLKHTYYFTGEKFVSVQQLLSSRQFHPEHLRAELIDLMQRSGNMQQVLNGIFEEEDLLYKVLAVRLAAYEGAPIEKLSPCYSETLYHMLLGGISSAHQVNAVEEETYVELLSVKGGNALLPEKMAERLKDRVHLNQILTRVSKDIDGSFLLTFQGGQKIKADILVLAIPCSVYDQIKFEEEVIFSERLESIKNVQYGTNAKILVPFPKLPLDRLGLLNDRAVCFFNHENSVLTVYYTGSASWFSADTIMQTYNQERRMLEMGFEERCPLFIPPLFAKDQHFGNYEGVVGYSWPNDPYAKGSYSYIGPGQEALLTAVKEEQGEIVRTLFAPIDHKLYFAGEHASTSMDVPGTMEAACESGERAARMILNDLFKFREELHQRRA
jgi:monoamine oxidase